MVSAQIVTLYVSNLRIAEIEITREPGRRIDDLFSIEIPRKSYSCRIICMRAGGSVFEELNGIVRLNTSGVSVALVILTLSSKSRPKSDMLIFPRALS